MDHDEQNSLETTPTRPNSDPVHPRRPRGRRADELTVRGCRSSRRLPPWLLPRSSATTSTIMGYARHVETPLQRTARSADQRAVVTSRGLLTPRQPRSVAVQVEAEADMNPQLGQSSDVYPATR